MTMLLNVKVQEDEPTGGMKHQMTEIYVVVDEFLEAHPEVAPWRRRPRARPAFTEAETLPIAPIPA